MLTRKTQYAWMALGGLICLLGLVLACKLRDGNKASAQPEPLPLPALDYVKDQPANPPAAKNKPVSAPLAPTWDLRPVTIKALPKADKPVEQTRNVKSSTPKGNLTLAFPSDPPPLPPARSPKLEPPLPSPAPILTASFGGPSTPPPQPKPSEPVPPPLSLKDSPHSPKDSKPADKVGSKKEPSNASKPPLTPPASTYQPYAKTAPASPPKAPAPTLQTQSPPVSTWNVPNTVIPASAAPPSDRDSARTQPGEPPLAPAPGPVQIYHVHGTETLQEIARRTLGSSERWIDLHKLNPAFKQDEPLSSGTTVRLPADACVQTDDAEPVKPLPALRPKPPTPKAKVLPLTGTYQCSLDEKGQLTLPRAIRDQMNGCDTVLLSPGPDKCLWLTNQAHLERLGERLEQSRANEADVRVFKRLYYAQTEKQTVNSDGRITIPERLGQFAGLHQEVVLVGIDDHFEVWDSARWRSYTQQKSATQTTAATEQE